MNTLILPAALPVLRENSKMAALVNRDLDIAAKEKNATIRVALPQNMGTADDMNTSTGSTSTDLEDPKVDVVLDKWKYKQFQMNDKEMRESLASGILPSAAEAAIKSIANQIDADLLALYKDVPFHAGTAGTTLSSADTIIAARKLLQANNVPLGDRRLVIDVEAEAALLSLFKDYDKIGDTLALNEASLGRRFGLDIYADQLVPSHTKGTVALAAAAINGAVAAGAQSAILASTGASATIKKGDIFTVADVTGQYVVTADVTASGGGAATIAFYPPAPVGGFPDTKVLTFKASHRSNLIFHKDAFCLAMRTLQDEASESSTVSSAVDPVSGIPLRLETWRDPKLSTRFWRFDVLYGVKTLRPELAGRLLG